MPESKPPPSGYPGVLPMEGVYPGFYRGTVIQNDDRPTKEGGNASPPTADDKGPFGRVRVSVPQVYGDKLKTEDLPWAEVCYPFGGGPNEKGLLSGIVFVPRLGTAVWVGFEHGDPQRPIVVGQWFGRADDKVEIPREAIDRSRTPYKTEKERSGVTYPDIFIIKPPGAVGDKEKLAMCIRFVGDKRIDIILNNDTFIELDAGGSPQETDPLLLQPMIRVHSGSQRIALTSDMADPAAILLLARNGGIRIDAKTQISTVCRSGGIAEEAGADPVVVRAKLAAAAAAGLPAPKLSLAEAISLGTVGAAGSITRASVQDMLDVAGPEITHQAKTLRGNGTVAGAYVHPKG